MEAFITPPDPASFSDPLTRLLAAILHWLQNLLAQHQAGLLPLARPRGASPRKTAEQANTPGPAEVRPVAVRARPSHFGRAYPRALSPRGPGLFVAGVSSRNLETLRDATRAARTGAAVEAAAASRRIIAQHK